MVLAVLPVSFSNEFATVLLDDVSATLVSLLLFADVLHDVIENKNADETIGKNFRKRIFFYLKVEILRKQKVFFFHLTSCKSVITFLSFLFFLYIITPATIITPRPIKSHIHHRDGGFGVFTIKPFPGNIFKLSTSAGLQ